MADTENLAGTILKGLESFADNLQWNGKAILRSNEAINPITGVHGAGGILNSVGKFIMGEADTGIRGTLHNLSKEGGMGLKEAVDAAYHVGEGEARKLNFKAIAGTYVGASHAGRVLTGAGICRDRNGNPNVPGVPFI